MNTTTPPPTPLIPYGGVDLPRRSALWLSFSRSILRMRLWLARRRHEELMDEWCGHYADEKTYREMIAVGSRINVLIDRLELCK